MTDRNIRSVSKLSRHTTGRTDRQKKLARRLAKFDDERRRLMSQLVAVGFIWHGNITTRRRTCGQPSCRCHADAKFRHGPYACWTTKVRGKTVSRVLTPAEADLYEGWIRNRRRIEQVVKALKKLAEKAAPLILEGQEAAKEDRVGRREDR